MLGANGPGEENSPKHGWQLSKSGRTGMYLGHAESKMRQVCSAVGSESLGSGQELAVVPHSTCLTMAGESMGRGDGLHSLSATKFQLTFLLYVTVIPPFVPLPGPQQHTHKSHMVSVDTEPSAHIRWPPVCTEAAGIKGRVRERRDHRSSRVGSPGPLQNVSP